jgi:hypothetical protein
LHAQEFDRIATGRRNEQRRPTFRLTFGEQFMRALIALVVVVYFIGIGVALSPTIQAKWNTASASDLATSVAQELPNAVAWPARVYRNMTDRG